MIYEVGIFCSAKLLVKTIVIWNLKGLAKLSLQKGGGYFKWKKLTRQLFLSYVDLSLIHVIQNSSDFTDFNIFKEYNGMFARILHEQSLEIWWASRENHFVAFNRSVIACQCDITKCLRLVKVVQHRQEVVLVIVPLEAEHLGQGVHLGDGELGQQTEKKEAKNELSNRYKHMQF